MQSSNDAYTQCIYCTLHCTCTNYELLFIQINSTRRAYGTKSLKILEIQFSAVVNIQGVEDGKHMIYVVLLANASANKLKSQELNLVNLATSIGIHQD